MAAQPGDALAPKQDTGMPNSNHARAPTPDRGVVAAPMTGLRRSSLQQSRQRTPASGLHLTHTTALAVKLLPAEWPYVRYFDPTITPTTFL